MHVLGKLLIYLEINCITSSKPFLHLLDRDIGISVKVIEVADPITVEEGPSHRTVKSDAMVRVL
jgi:hypothetical protein